MTRREDVDETITSSSESPIVLTSATIALLDNDRLIRTEEREGPATINLMPPYPNPGAGIITFSLTAHEIPRIGLHSAA